MLVVGGDRADVTSCDQRYFSSLTYREIFSPSVKSLDAMWVGSGYSRAARCISPCKSCHGH